MTWKDEIKKYEGPESERYRTLGSAYNPDPDEEDRYEEQYGESADKSKEKALDALDECLMIIEKWKDQHYSPYESERRLNPAKFPAKYGSASGKLEREPTHELIFKIKGMIEEHFIDER